MKIKSLIVTLVAGTFFLGSCNNFKSSKVQLKTLADSAAYAIGIDIGNNIRKIFLQLRVEKILTRKLF